MLVRLKPVDTLADEMVSKIPQSLFDSDITTFVDPDPATGAYIGAIARRLKRHGHAMDNINNRLFGFFDSRMQYNWFFHKYGIEPQKLTGDFLESKMNFDVIIGNPPFQETTENNDRKDQASNLWTKFWSKSLEIGTIVALITPTTWLSPSRDLKQPHEGETRLWNVFEKYKSLANVTTVKGHFPGVGSTFGYVIVDQSKTGGLSFIEGFDTSLGFLPISNIENVIANVTNDPEENIRGRFQLNQSNKPTHRVAVPMTRKVTADSVQILDGECVPEGAKSGLFIYLYCDPSESPRLKDLVVKNSEILNTDCRWSGFMNIKILEKLKYVD